MKVTREPIALVALAALAVVAATVLTALHHPVPQWFELLGIAGVTGGAGLAVPARTAVTDEGSSAVGVPAPPAAGGQLADVPDVAPAVTTTTTVAAPGS